MQKSDQVEGLRGIGPIIYQYSKVIKQLKNHKGPFAKIHRNLIRFCVYQVSQKCKKAFVFYFCDMSHAASDNLIFHLIGRKYKTKQTFILSKTVMAHPVYENCYQQDTRKLCLFCLNMLCSHFMMSG